MILHFTQTLVRTLLAHSETAAERRPTISQAGTPGPGLWLVGDEGVYLLSNGLPRLLREPIGGTPARNLVCYAEEANPETLSRDRADAAKQASFGGDDGVEFLDAADLRTALASYPDGEPLELEVTPETIAVLLCAGPAHTPHGGTS